MMRNNSSLAMLVVICLFSGCAADVSNAFVDDPLFATGMSELALGNSIRADALFAQVDLAEYDKPRFLESVGIAMSDAGSYELSLKYFDLLLEVEPENSENWTNRGIVYMRMLLDERALADANTSIDIDPAYETGIRLRASLLGGLRRWGEAKDDYVQLIKLSPDNSDYWMWAGVSMFFEEDRQASLRHLNKAAELGADSFDFHFFSALISYEYGLESEGLNHLYQAIAATNEPGILSNIFQYAEQKGAQDDAE